MRAQNAHNPKVAGSNPAPATNEDPCYGRDLLHFQPVYADREIDARPRAGRETFEEASWKVRSSPSIVASSSDGKRCP